MSRGKAEYRLHQERRLEDALYRRWFFVSQVLSQLSKADPRWQIVQSTERICYADLAAVCERVDDLDQLLEEGH